MFENIAADIRHYRFQTGKKKHSLLRTLIVCLYSHPAIAAVLLYRFGHWSYNLHIPVVRGIAKLVYLLFQPLVRLYSGVQINPNTKVGKGLVIFHFGGVVLCRYCSIGEQCVLHHNFSIVTTNDRQAARIGNNFWCGVGVVIVGNIIIEDNVICGAGSIVTKSVPANAVVAGSPAKIVRFRLPTEMPPKEIHGHHTPEPFLQIGKSETDNIEAS